MPLKNNRRTVGYSKKPAQKEVSVEQAAKNFGMDIRLYRLFLEVRKIGAEIHAEHGWKSIKACDPLIRFESTLFDINKELKRLKGTK